ncbi:winged helix-turn-helix domain-containing protein [Mangrovimonas xylaniphaga]|uniref:winged helix-turn-helix domain-containing protein n=1 Tax=Mangrovimonas xylaniphaga TaxID=1645915 RepID=UPI000AF67E22|nr:winged helix-turn-helix domain-containing protein [Mangrovimonas xylaniphaga]
MMTKLYYKVTLLLLSLLIVACSESVKEHSPERIKVGLREAGHQLLLQSGDSSSRVLPVVALDPSTYELSFEQSLQIIPDSLVAIVERSLERAELSDRYLVEVLQCEDAEVAYSYEMWLEGEQGIVPCQGRLLPQSCYRIHVKFIEGQRSNSNLVWLWLLPVGVLGWWFFGRKHLEVSELAATKEVPLGRFMFYPEQHKLVTPATEIALSKKECELLELFVERPNQVISRDELSKRVWEDHGVVVGRSLDTYISKLRKKLQDDERIQLVNIHGVGYKLEVN